MKKSANYHDYVIKEGKFIGKFEEMYQNSSDVPWHQDETAYELFVEIDLALIKRFHTLHGFMSIGDIGCGLGYITERLRRQLSEVGTEARFTGIDISKTAISKAQRLFPNIAFLTRNILLDDISDLTEKFDFVYMKDIIWYVLNDIECFISKLRQIITPGGFIYVFQSIPDTKEFYGSHLFPDTFTMAAYLDNYFDKQYVSSTYEVNKKRIVGNYSKDKYLRFLGCKR